MNIWYFATKQNVVLSYYSDITAFTCHNSPLILHLFKMYPGVQQRKYNSSVLRFLCVWNVMNPPHIKPIMRFFFPGSNYAIFLSSKIILGSYSSKIFYVLNGNIPLCRLCLVILIKRIGTCWWFAGWWPAIPVRMSCNLYKAHRIMLMVCRLMTCNPCPFRARSNIPPTICS